MKQKIIFVMSFLLMAFNLSAVPVVLSWKGNNPPDTVDYIIQEQLPDGTWEDVLSTKSNTITLDLVPAVYKFQVIARGFFWGAIRESDPSNMVITPSPNPQAPTDLEKKIGA